MPRLYSERYFEEGNDPVVLHGDLHPWNILSVEREPWLAIDLKGVVDDPAHDLGPFIYNLPFPKERPARVLASRLDQFAEELGFEREPIGNAATSRAVLAAWPKGPAEVAWPNTGAEVLGVPLASAQLLAEL